MYAKGVAPSLTRSRLTTLGDNSEAEKGEPQLQTKRGEKINFGGTTK